LGGLLELPESALHPLLGGDIVEHRNHALRSIRAGDRRGRQQELHSLARVGLADDLRAANLLAGQQLIQQPVECVEFVLRNDGVELADCVLACPPERLLGTPVPAKYHPLGVQFDDGKRRRLEQQLQMAGGALEAVTLSPGVPAFTLLLGEGQHPLGQH
jgi:hypothetical protein